jgi:hypothetical protein
MSPSQMTSATLMNSEGWNGGRGPSSNQFVLPPTVTPSGVATTSTCSAHAKMSIGQATRIQNRAGSRLAMSMMGIPNSA